MFEKRITCDRIATEADVDCISALAIQVFLDTYATNGVSPDLAREALSVYSPEIFLSRLKSPEKYSVHIAESEGHILGFAEVDIIAKPPVAELENSLELAKLYIQPRFHRQGVGSGLLAAVERYGLDREKKHIWLTAWAGNANAIGFYSHYGYQDVGTAEYIIEGQSYENRVLSKRLL